jgi:Mg-chelatase subunit ChlD
VAGGGTPLGTALPIINIYMDKNKSQSSQKQMILLMADG